MENEGTNNESSGVSTSQSGNESSGVSTSQSGGQAGSILPTGCTVVKELQANLVHITASQVHVGTIIGPKNNIVTDSVTIVNGKEDKREPPEERTASERAELTTEEKVIQATETFIRKTIAKEKDPHSESTLFDILAILGGSVDERLKTLIKNPTNKYHAMMSMDPIVRKLYHESRPEIQIAVTVDDDATG